MMKNPPYHIVGICKDETEIQLSKQPYPSRGWGYATATKWAIDAWAAGNPDNLIRLELRDKDGNGLTEYNNSKLLIVD